MHAYAFELRLSLFEGTRTRVFATLADASAVLFLYSVGEADARVCGDVYDGKEKEQIRETIIYERERERLE